jgi:hypothetical protein
VDAARRPGGVERPWVEALLRVEEKIPFAIEVDALSGHTELLSRE